MAFAAGGNRWLLMDVHRSEWHRLEGGVTHAREKDEQRERNSEMETSTNHNKKSTRSRCTQSKMVLLF